jgi:hypothetical protein
MAGSFSISLSRFAAKSEKQIKTVIQKITMEAFRGVIEKTPVDVGRALGAWSPSIGSPTATETGRIDKTGIATIGAAKRVVFDWNCIGSIFLCNAAPYIAVLEYGGYPNPPKYGSVPTGLKAGQNPNGFREFRSAGGFSYKAPHGMVRVTLAEIAAQYGGR